MESVWKLDLKRLRVDALYWCCPATDWPATEASKSAPKKSESEFSRRNLTGW
jgi:hypothetical protein